MRAEPDDRSEMTSQLLFGELLEVVEKKGNWSFIRSLYDDYTGWVDSKQYTFVTDEDLERFNKSEVFYSQKPVSTIYSVSSRRELRIVLGSQFIGYVSGKIKYGDNEYVLRENPMELLPRKALVDSVLRTANLFMDSPYLWGGKTPFGVDCSGFTQSVFKVCGIKLKRDASQQVMQGEVIDFIGDVRAGDLAFFDNNEGKIIHVGIILPDNKIMHASGRVRIDLIDHNGIFNEEIGDYTHKLRIVKRFL